MASLPDDPPLRRCELDLTLDAAAPGAARRLLRLLLPQWGVGDRDLVDGATVVLSELVTNALVHSAQEGPVSVTLELWQTQLRLCVVDTSRAVPAQRVADQHAEDGRGLVLVDQLTSGWGVEPDPRGKRVFAELPLSPVACA